MPAFRRAHAVLIALAMAFPPRAARAQEPVVVLNLDSFTKRAIDASLRSRAINESFESRRYGYIAGRRSRTWPTLSATASRSIDGSDDDAGTETDGKTTTGTLALAQPLLTGARAAINATFSDSRDETYSGGDLLFSSESKREPAYTASLTQPIFLFTGNTAWRGWKQNKIAWDISQFDFHSGLLSLQFDARSLYYRLLLQIESVAVEKKKFESSGIIQRTTRTLVRAGKLPEVELIRAEIRANRDTRRIQNAEQSLEKSLNETKDFLQIAPESSVRFTSPLGYEPFKTPVSALVKEALKNSYAVRTVRKRLASSEIDLANTREADRPDISTFLNYALTRDRSDPLAPRDPSSWSAGVNLSWPIFDATLTRLRTRQAELSLDAAKRDVERTERETRVAVENAYIDLKRTEDQIKTFSLERKSAQQNLRAMQLRYQNGLTRLTDVFDAENEVRDLELEYLGLLVDYNVARDRLLVLVGRDLMNATKETE